MFDIAIENAFDFLSPEYAALFARAEATAFQHPLWLDALYRRLLVHNRAEPLVVVVRRRADGAPVLVLPLVRRRYGGLRVVEFADLRVSDYAAPVADPEAPPALAADRSLKRAIGRALRPYDLLRLSKLAFDDSFLETLLAAPTRRAMPMKAYAVPLETDFARWRALRLNASYRKELDKKGRQFAKKGEVRFSCATGPEIEAVLAMMRHHRGLRFRGQEGDLLQIAPYFDFYRAVAEAGEGGFARTYGLWLDGRPVAGALGLVHRGALLGVLSAFDARFKNQSLGSLMFEKVAADAIARGDRVLDFTIGDEAYKRTFGAEPREIAEISLPGSPLGHAAGFAIHRLPAVRKLARRVFHTARDRGAKISSKAGAASS